MTTTLMTKTYAHLAWHGESHITVDTSSGYVVTGSETLTAELVKTGALNVGDLVEWHVVKHDGKTVRREYCRITSIIPDNGGARIGFLNQYGIAQNEDVVWFMKYGYRKEWWRVIEQVNS
jgi:hypothetical protein